MKKTIAKITTKMELNNFDVRVLLFLLSQSDHGNFVKGFTQSKIALRLHTHRTAVSTSIGYLEDIELLKKFEKPDSLVKAYDYQLLI